MKKIKFIHLFTVLNCIIFLLLFNSNTKGQSVSITSNVSQICKGSAVTFTASVNPTNNLNGTYDGIRWLVSTDGGSTWQNTGERTTTYTTSSLLNNYQVQARATFATGRYSFYFVYSNIITVQVNETEIQDFNTISTITSGSIKFNGSYLSLSEPPIYGTDAFTIDGWFRLKDAPSNLAPILGSEGYGDLSVLIQSDLTTVSIDAYGDHATNFTVPTIAIGVWHHLAVVRNSSGDLSVFLDGQRSSDGHQSENFSFSTSSNVGEFQYYNFLSGFLANLRIVTGSALYDPTQTTITVPTLLTTAVTNTKLLLNALNASSLLTDGSATQTSITNNGGATWSGGTPFLANLNPSSNATISNATVGGVWSSSNNSILQVNSSSGVLTPIATGNATITYTLTTNTPVTCTVTESSLISTTVPQPSITSLSAASGCGAAAFTINGTDLTGAAAADVKVGGVPVSSITSNSGTQMVVVPVSGSSGAVTVKIGSNTSNSTYSYTSSSYPGAFGNALRLDGSNDYVNVPNVVVPSTGEFTVAVWAKRLVNNGTSEIFAQGANFYFGPNGNGKFRIGDPWEPNVNFPTDQLWHHYVIVRDPNESYFYMDGALVDTFTCSWDNTITNIPLPTNGNLWGDPVITSFKIGSQFDGGEVFNGLIDELSIWNNAKTADQVRAIMNVELVGNENNLVAYYNFNQGIAGGSNGSETTLYDRTSNGNNGTLTNMALTGSSSNWVGSYTYTMANITGTTSVCPLSTTQMSNTTLGGVWSFPNSTYATVSSSGLVTGVATGTPTLSYKLTSGVAGCTDTKTASMNILACPTAPSGTGASRCSTGTITISATPGAGEFIDWYDAATGGSLLLSGSSTYTTSSISTTTNYYAAARNTTTGCVSATRTAVTATVKSTSAFTENITACGSYTWHGTTYTTSTSSVALGDSYEGGKVAYILQPGDQGYDASAIKGFIVPITANGHIESSDFGCNSTLINGANGTSIGSGAQNTVDILNDCSGSSAAKSCDTYSVTENSIVYSDWYLPSKEEMYQIALNRNLIGGLQSWFYWTSTQTSNSQAYCVNAQGTPSYADMSKSFDAYRLPIRNFSISKIMWTGTNAAGCDSVVTLNLTINPLPGSPSAGNNSRCGIGTVGLSASGTGTIKWYNASTAGTLLSSGNSFTTPSISSTTIYYAMDSIVATGCVSASRTAVTATVNALPSAPTAGNNSRCSTGTVTISATPVSSEAIDWYEASSGGSALSSNSTSYTTPSISSTTSYYAEARNSSTGCLSASRTAVTATINPLPDATISASGATTFTYGNSVVLSGPAFVLPSVVESVGNALSLNGTGNYVSIPSGINNNFSGNQITVEGWFYPTQQSFNTTALIGEAYEGDGVVKFTLFSEFGGGAQKIRAGFYSDAYGWLLGTSSVNLSFNQWSHIAATYDQANIKIYVNGSLTCTYANTNALPNGSERWLLGKQWQFNNFFPGTMDEVRIWNVARTQAQIQFSMNNRISPTTSGLVGYYKLDESSGTTATDATGHGYDGTVN